MSNETPLTKIFSYKAMFNTFEYIQKYMNIIDRSILNSTGKYILLTMEDVRSQFRQNLNSESERMLLNTTSCFSQFIPSKTPVCVSRKKFSPTL